MGNKLSLRKKKIEDVSVDSLEEQKKNPKVQKFSISIFRKGEWALVRAFCQKHEIKQAHLVTVFRTYLTNEEVYVRKFRIRLNDPKVKFASFSMLMQELADVFFPGIFLKEFPRLEMIENPEEVTFARFIIMSYVFGAQAPPEIIYDFLSILRKNLRIHTTALVAVYSFQQICNLVIEDLQNCGTLKYLKRCIGSLDTNKDIKISNIILIGIKYPLIFYSLVRFRKYFQRFVFGDKFWKSRKLLKLKSVEFHHFPEYHTWFENEDIARKITAKFFLMDVLYGNKIFDLNYIFYESMIDTISHDEMLSLIDLVGYKFARRLTIEAEINYDRFDPFFLQMFLSSKHPSSSAANRIDQEDLEKEQEENDCFIDSRGPSREHNRNTTSRLESHESRVTISRGSIPSSIGENNNMKIEDLENESKGNFQNEILPSMPAARPRLSLMNPAQLARNDSHASSSEPAEPSAQSSPFTLLQKRLSGLKQTNTITPPVVCERNIISDAVDPPVSSKEKSQSENASPFGFLQKQMSMLSRGKDNNSTNNELGTPPVAGSSSQQTELAGKDIKGNEAPAGLGTLLKQLTFSSINIAEKKQDQNNDFDESPVVNMLKRQMTALFFGGENDNNEEENGSSLGSSEEEEDEEDLPETTNIEYLNAKEEDVVKVVRDDQFHRDFVYNVNTGRTSWLRTAMTDAGRVLKKFV
jgi:hypothetical protein